MEKSKTEKLVEFCLLSGSPDLRDEFLLLKDASDLYASYGDVDGVQDPVINKKRAKILEDCGFLIDSIAGLGVDRDFLTTFVCYGDAFLVKETGKTFTEIYNRG